VTAPWVGSGNIYEEISRRNRKRFGKFYDIFQRDISLSPLNRANVVAMESSPLCQLLLR
jgi:hypothetical protein